MARCSRCRGSGKEPDGKAVSVWARAARKTLGLSLLQLSSEVDTSVSSLATYERNGGPWTGPQAHRILDFLEQRTGELAPHG